jgi:hypothetical protein
MWLWPRSTPTSFLSQNLAINWHANSAGDQMNFLDILLKNWNSFIWNGWCWLSTSYIWWTGWCAPCIVSRRTLLGLPLVVRPIPYSAFHVTLIQNIL